MADPVHVRSIEEMKNLVGALVQFAAEGKNGLQQAASGFHETRDWLVQRRAHWVGEVLRRSREVESAREALRECEADEDRSSCSSEKEALARAERRKREAEEEVRVVDRARRSVEEAWVVYQAEAAHLRASLDTNVVRVIASLNGDIAVHESHVRSAPPSI
jgi:hypothetical protein